MPEVKKKIDVFRLDYICDKCEKGRMRHTGLVLTSMPPQYPHECDECGHAQTFRGFSYPTQVFEDERE